jgi:hypothetical protein
MNRCFPLVYRRLLTLSPTTPAIRMSCLGRQPGGIADRGFTSAAIVGRGSSDVLDTVIASFEAEAEPLKARVESVKAEAVKAETYALNAETKALNAKTKASDAKIEASKARTEAIEATNAASDAMLEAIEAETEANKATKEASHAMIEALKAGTEVIKVTNEASGVQAKLEALNAELQSHTGGDLRSFMRDVQVPIVLAVLAKCACKLFWEPCRFFPEDNVGTIRINQRYAMSILRPHLDSNVVKWLDPIVCI